MATYYIDIDDNGTEIKTEKKRGPTRKGYTKREDGNWVRDPNYVPQEKVAKKKVYIRFDEDTGKYDNHREVTRGRRPSGYISFDVEDADVVACENEKIPENAQLESIPVKQIIAEVKGLKTTRIVRYDEPVDFEFLIKSIKGVQRKSGDHISLTLCDIYPRCPIAEIRNMSSVSRIDIDLSTRELSVWQFDYREGNPDVVISNAFVQSTVNV